jgi:lycopene cyclase domain-containing protein
MPYTYLIINLSAVAVPLLASFHPGLKFYKGWGALAVAMLISCAVFLPWDMYFTHLKIWGFNPRYLTGHYIGNLPVEEVLFFICIPYCCVFTFQCLNNVIKVQLSASVVKIITLTLIGFSIMMALLFRDRMYTCYTFAFLTVILCIGHFVLKVKWMLNFYIIYGILLIPFLIVNGLLTGTGLDEPVVWYNNAQNLDLRILTIPVEDVFYGMGLILLNLVVYMRMRKNADATGLPVL